MQRRHLPENSVAVHRTIYRVDASSGSFFGGIGHVHANTLVDRARLGFANNNFLDFAILAEVFIASKRLQENIFVLDRRYQPDHVDKILLFDSDAGEIATTGGFDFALLALLSLRRSLFLDLVLLVELELLRRRYLVLNCFFVIDSAAVWTSAFLVGGLETIETELADLWRRLSVSRLWKSCGQSEELITIWGHLPDSHKGRV
jgi:hypothetical protein